MTRINYANLKSIKADITKGEITIAISMSMTPANLADAQYLSIYTGEDQHVDVDIIPHQLTLLDPQSEKMNELTVKDWDKAFEAAEAERKAQEEPPEPIGDTDPGTWEPEPPDEKSQMDYTDH